MRSPKLFSLAIVTASILFTTTSHAKSMVWKISKDSDHFYLGGTIHVLSESDHPLPEEFMEAYKNSDEIILETDVSAAQSPEFQAKLMQIMLYNDGRTLADELSDEAYSALEALMTERGMPIAQFAPFKPWAVTLILTLQEYEKLGMVPEYGVEMFVENLATEDGKEIQSLETADAQLSFLASLADIDPNLSVQYFIRDLETMPKAIEALKVGWRDGDVDSIENNPMTIQMRDDFPEVYNTLLVERNNNWMKQLTTLFDDNMIEVVLVGALHLSGDSGLLVQLEKAGFTVTQLD